MLANVCLTKGSFKVLRRHREQTHSTPYLYQASSLVGEDRRSWKKVRVGVRPSHMVRKQGK